MRKLICVFLPILGIAFNLHAQAVGGAASTGTNTGARSEIEQQPDSIRQQEMLPAKVVAEVARIFNSRSTIRLRGDSSVRISSTVPSSIAILRGQLVIGGHVRGSVVAINADVVLEPNALVDEDIVVVGGKVGMRENGRVRGDIRTYPQTMVLEERSDSIIPDARYTDEGKWWSGLQLDTPHNRSKISVRGETYNRVEGLPILIGPSFRHIGPLLRTNVEALGIIRSADRFRWDSENLGHLVELSTRLNTETGIGIGGSLYDVVSPVEVWQFTENEAGLATFVLHRDFRDYYGRHGGSANFSVFHGFGHELKFSFAKESWTSRDVRDTWTLFRDDKPWRANPEVHEGSLHILSASLKIDTRNSEENPWAGWMVDATIERGKGDLAAPSSPTTFVESMYSRAMIDFRRYNRISPRGQLNFRIVYGARLGDDQLPLQKRFSVGGPGSLPGFDFRRLHGGTDVGMCTTGGALTAGAPALCERMALFQVEYRGDIHLDLFGASDKSDDWRDVGRHPGAQWVIFADAGRGWLLEDATTAPVDGLTYPSGTLLPRFGTFRTDVGAGMDVGPVGVFMSKAVSQSGVPANFFVRLRHRF